MSSARVEIVLCISFIAIVSIGCRESKNLPDKYAQSLSRIESTVEKLFAQYGIDGKSIKTRKVASGDGTFSRVERRVAVAPVFNTLSFNHDLNIAIVETGATVIATEKTEDKSVTMHIKQDGIILQSIVFTLKKEH